MRQGYIIKCTKCGKEYDLARATTLTKDGDVRCPHCNGIVGRRNS
jgi:DNA-directed RNA polymerase subunit RPC12/RpoP